MERLTIQTLEKCGYTSECAGCTTAFLGGTGVNHSESCRMRIERAIKDDTVDRHRVRNAKRKVREFVQAHMPENLKKLDRQEVPSSPSKETSSSSRAILAGTKRSAQQDAEDFRQGDNESPRIGTKWSRDPDEQKDGDGMLIGYTVDEEADLEKSLVGFQGIVEDHCDDDNVSGEIKQRWADMEDTDTDDMSSDAVYDDISGQQLDGTLVRFARMNELEGLSNMGVWDIVDKGVCYQKTGKPPIRGRWVDVNKDYDKSPVYRSRYVAQELRRQHSGNTREGLFAAMPPLEATKALIPDVATRCGQGGDPQGVLSRASDAQERLR